MRAQATMTPLWTLMRDNDAGPSEILFHLRVTRPPIDVRDPAVRPGVEVRDSAQGMKGLVRSTETPEHGDIGANRGRSEHVPLTPAIHHRP